MFIWLLPASTMLWTIMKCICSPNHFIVIALQTNRRSKLAICCEPCEPSHSMTPACEDKKAPLEPASNHFLFRSLINMTVSNISSKHTTGANLKPDYSDVAIKINQFFYCMQGTCYRSIARCQQLSLSGSCVNAGARRSRNYAEYVGELEYYHQ